MQIIWQFTTPVNIQQERERIGYFVILSVTLLLWSSSPYAINSISKYWWMAWCTEQRTACYVSSSFHQFVWLQTWTSGWHDVVDHACAYRCHLHLWSPSRTSSSLQLLPTLHFFSFAPFFLLAQEDPLISLSYRVILAKSMKSTIATSKTSKKLTVFPRLSQCAQSLCHRCTKFDPQVYPTQNKWLWLIDRQTPCNCYWSSSQP